MNLIEAIKSGKRFKKACEANWRLSGGLSGNFYSEDIVYEGWEVEEKSVPITRSQFWDAVSSCCKIYVPYGQTTAFIPFDKIAKLLGLE